MASDTRLDGAVNGHRWRMFGWGIAAAVLMLPFVAMRLTSEVNWTGSDFLFAGVLIGGSGLLIELTIRATSNAAYRAGVGLAVTAGCLTIWACGAVGMIGDEDNPLNLMFGGVLLLALLGAALSRFRASGMSRAMLVAAAAQLLASGIGMFTDLRGGIFSALFAVVWLTSAAMFRMAGVAQP